MEDTARDVAPVPINDELERTVKLDVSCEMRAMVGLSQDMKRRHGR